MKDDHARRRWSRVLVAALACCALLVGLAACGGDNGSTSTSATAAGTSTAAAPATTPQEQGNAADTANNQPEKQATGTPVKTMTITSLDSQGPVYPNIANTAEYFEKWVNQHGGIGGRPLQVDVCDEHGKPNDAAACARKAVSDNVVAVVGSFSFLGTNIMPALEKAGIANFGECCPITPPEWTASNSFPMGNQPLYAVGFTKWAMEEEHCETTNAVIIDGAQGFLPPMENSMKAYGKKFNKVIILPPTSQDYTPQVAEATSGNADCVFAVVSETPFVAFNQAWVQSGTKARLFGPQGNLDNVSIKGLGNALDGSIISGMYPDLATAPWAVYRQVLKDNNAPSDVDFNSLGGMGTWAAYTGFKQVAEAIPGGADSIDAASFMKQAAETTNLDTKGMVPVLDFTKEWTEYPDYRRLFNRTVVFSTIKDGKVVPLTTDFQDVGELALGKKPAQ